MGYLNIPVFNMLTNLGVTVIEAPPITKKTIELGSQYSPEGVCLPYKINMGNFIEGIERGADTLVTICGAGKCRQGFYNTMQKITLSEKAPLQFHTINTSENLFANLYIFLQTVAPNASRLSILKNIALAIKTLKALDALNNAKNYYGARTKNADTIIDIYNSGIQQLGQCRTFREVTAKQTDITAKMQAVATGGISQPAKVGLVGEIYLLLEPYVNHNIENMLIKQGVEVKKFVYTGDWAYSQIILRTLGLYNEETAYLKQARPYLNYHVGGEGLKSVGTALWYTQHNYDGIIHLYPFGCMPEIVAQYALRNISRDYNLPMLALSVDEHASDVGMITRLEAFIDCLTRKPK
jgi:predicted nucleotide-binding protein (sugar kinase/HSP70/actin superfamily)